MALGDRLREIVGGWPDPVPAIRRSGACAQAAPGDAARRLRQAAALLGGDLAEAAGGACVVVDRLYPAVARHGRAEVGALVGALRGARESLALLGRAWPSAGGLQDTPLCFLDVETTGLTGGAGTLAFLVGCAVVERDGVRVRQFLMPGFEHERAQLAALAAWLSGPAGRADASLVTFNGRAFDLPLIEMRFAYHRQTCPLAERPHLDMLHAARRLWHDEAAASGCSLGALERRLAGVERAGDVPAWEIPARYIQFVRDGDARPLAAVLEHNRLDLLSTALLLARAVGLIARGPAAAATAAECLGLGRVFERAGAQEEAAACYRHAAAHPGAAPGAANVAAEALRRLALLHRRAGRLEVAAVAWRELLDRGGGAPAWRREAREALAIHHEHRTGDLAYARQLVLDLLADRPPGRARAAAEHRLRRLERKLRRPATLTAALDDEPTDPVPRG